MTPYWTSHDGRHTLYHGDCLEVLPTLAPGTVDAVVTDPPYGIFKDTDTDGMMFGKPTIYGADKSAATWDIRPTPEAIKMIMAVRLYVVWGGNYFADMMGASKGVLVWHKKTGNNSYADGELAFTNVTGTMRIFEHQWCGAFKDSERGQRAIHPTQKPVALMQWCLGFLPPGCLVLDAYAGSGTTGVACIRTGRRSILVEMEERYCEIAAKRMEAELAQPMLIPPGPMAPEQPDLLSEPNS